MRFSTAQEHAQKFINQREAWHFFKVPQEIKERLDNFDTMGTKERRKLTDKMATWLVKHNRTTFEVIELGYRFDEGLSDVESHQQLSQRLFEDKINSGDWAGGQRLMDAARRSRESHSEVVTNGET